MSTGFSSTETNAGQDSAPTPGGKSRRRKTSHLKDVPESLALRESLRDRCEQVADRLDRTIPMTKDELEQISRRTLEEADLPEAYLGWVMVMISTSFWRHQLKTVPPERRLFLLPHCLKHAEGCPADYDEFGMNCKECGACSIADFRGLAEEMGYRVLVAEGSPVVMKIIVGGYVDAVVGVACLNVLEKAIDKVLLAGIPCMAVPLLSSDCRNTKVDESWVDQMIRTPYEPAEQQTRSYVHLMRAAGELFEPQRLETIVPRTRGTQPFGDGQLDSAKVASMDAIEATEHISYDFLTRGGKHSRPFITMAAYDAMTGGDCTSNTGVEAVKKIPNAVLRAALSIETFHKASLVHDDIEDDDGFRYGQPALHKEFGIPTAINVGDYLVGMGYRLISDRAAMQGADASAQLDVLDCLAAAHTRLGEGQGAELVWRDAADRNLTPLDALKIYALKTSPHSKRRCSAAFAWACPVTTRPRLTSTGKRSARSAATLASLSKSLTTSVTSPATTTTNSPPVATCSAGGRRCCGPWRSNRLTPNRNLGCCTWPIRIARSATKPDWPKSNVSTNRTASSRPRSAWSTSTRNAPKRLPIRSNRMRCDDCCTSWSIPSWNGPRLNLPR